MKKKIRKGHQFHYYFAKKNSREKGLAELKPKIMFEIISDGEIMWIFLHAIICYDCPLFENAETKPFELIWEKLTKRMAFLLVLLKFLIPIAWYTNGIYLVSNKKNKNYQNALMVLKIWLKQFDLIKRFEIVFICALFGEHEISFA